MTDAEIWSAARAWAENVAYDASSRAEIQKLIDTKALSELTDRFYKELEFGTGGIRGVVGAGQNRMNIYNIKKVTQGLANYCLAQFKPSTTSKEPSVVIGYDSRLSSVTFSRATAEVLAANGFIVHYFSFEHATPQVSFGIRYFKAIAGIVVTASHNPPNYNGYKVSWSDGAQVTAPHDIGIIKEVQKITNMAQVKSKPWDQAVADHSIQIIGPEAGAAYGEAIHQLFVLTEDNPLSAAAKTAKEKYSEHIIYSPLHGVGGVFINHLFNQYGFSRFKKVESQFKPDGHFPTITSPNPENESAFVEAKKIATSEDWLILATDPDADRLGVVYNARGHAHPQFNLEPFQDWYKLSGNQIGQVLLYSWLNLLKKRGNLPSNGFTVSTIVSSELGRKITEGFGMQYYETLTGFKFINACLAEKQAQGEKYVFGYEESFGYQFGDFVREKDGLTASLFFAQLDYLNRQGGKTALQVLEEIYTQHGFHADQLVDIVLPGALGSAKIQELMKNLRTTPPQNLAGQKVVAFKDYKTLENKDLITGISVKLPTGLESNVFAIYLANGTRITARPSGTEPKIKFYFNFCGPSPKSVREFYQTCNRDYLQLLGLTTV